MQNISTYFPHAQGLNQGYPPQVLIPAVHFEDVHGNRLYDEDSISFYHSFQEAVYQNKLHLLLKEKADLAAKAEWTSFLKAHNQFDLISFDNNSYNFPYIIKKRNPDDCHVIRKPFSSCSEFRAFIVKDIESGNQSIFLSFKKPDGSPCSILIHKEDFHEKTLYEKFIYSGGSICFRGNGIRPAELLFAFVGSIVDTTHILLKPPIGWYQLNDCSWVYNTGDKELLSVPLLGSGPLNSMGQLAIALLSICSILKTRLPQEICVHKLFAISSEYISVRSTLSLNETPKVFEKRLHQNESKSFLPICGDNPQILSIVGDYRPKSNYTTLILKTQTEPRCPLFLIVSHDGITELQRKNCLFLPTQKITPAILPLSETFSSMIDLVLHNQNVFDDMVKQAYQKALDSVDEDCAFRHELASLSVASVVLCWTINFFAPEQTEFIRCTCQAFLNSCLNEWDGSSDSNALDIWRQAMSLAEKDESIQFIQYGNTDESYNPERDIICHGNDLLIKGSLLRSIVSKYMPGYSATDILVRLRSECFLSGSSCSKKIRIANGKYQDVRLLTLKITSLNKQIIN